MLQLLHISDVMGENMAGQVNIRSLKGVPVSYSVLYIYNVTCIIQMTSYLYAFLDNLLLHPRKTDVSLSVC